MRERGKYQIQLMKTRSSSGVGMKIDLDFDIDTLRITDPGEEGQTEADTTSRSSQILNNLQRNSTVNSDPTEGISVSVSKVQVESSKLRQLLSNLPTDP